MLSISPTQWLPIGVTLLTLVLLEGLLSADNALVLAVMVRPLPKHQQKRALRFGIWGAFAFRFVAVMLATRILDYWQFEVVGGLYLLYLAFSHLLFSGHDPEPGKGKGSGTGRSFWGTVVAVELADIAFSIDSILAAVGLADELPQHLHQVMVGIFSIKDWVIYAGGVLGIIMMRFVAGFFLILLDRFRGLAAGAYYLVAWIGLKLILSGFEHAIFEKSGKRRVGGWHDQVPDWIARHLDMPAWLFWAGMAVIVIISMLYKPAAPHDSEQTVKAL